MKWISRSAMAALLTATVCGCQTMQTPSDMEETVIRAQCEECNSCEADYWQEEYLDNTCETCPTRHCRNDKCGISGLLCCTTKETWALLGVLTSYRWEGEYPNGALHGWRGSWCGPFGSGCLDTTVPPCDPPGAY